MCMGAFVLVQVYVVEVVDSCPVYTLALCHNVGCY